MLTDGANAYLKRIGIKSSKIILPGQFFDLLRYELNNGQFVEEGIQCPPSEEGITHIALLMREQGESVWIEETLAQNLPDPRIRH